jgi:hypothetical protein
VPGLRGRQVLGVGGCIGGGSVRQLWGGDLLGGRGCRLDVDV